MRHDHNVIKAIAKLYGTETARKIQELPFFYISPDIEKQFTSTENLNSEGYGLQLPEYVVPIYEQDEIERILPFREFTLMDHNIGWWYVRYLGGNSWKLTVAVDPEAAARIGMVPVGLLITTHITFVERQDNDLIVDAQMGIVDPPHVVIPDIFKQAITITKDATGIESMKSVGRNLEYYMSFFKWADTKHMVRVQPKPSTQDLKSEKHGDKKPWTRTDKPYYIYLDAPTPETTSGHGTGSTSGHRRGHHRRAHWRTLNHPRFKNHPQYGAKIRVRPTWVGPTEWVVDGKTYTVMTQA